MKGSLSDKVKDYIAKNPGVTEEQVRQRFKTRACYQAIYYAKKTGAIKEIGGGLYYEGKYFQIDKAWKAMRYLRRFTASDIAKMAGCTRHVASAYFTVLSRAGYIKKVGVVKTDRGRRVVYSVIKDCEKPVLTTGGKNACS
uniref:Uncharacterized protein n=1 Tax=Thermodesulfovibrio aggregans TaxID=86166 RepID=A0A7C4EKS8_9BACT